MMSYERTLLTKSHEKEATTLTEFTEFTEEQKDSVTITFNPRNYPEEGGIKKRSIKIHALPLLVVVIVILLFVSAYLLHKLITDQEDDTKTTLEENFKSKFSFPGCGRSQCKGSACASRVRRLVRGEEASKNDWPWMVEILIDNLHSCGGVLVNQLYVMTAAHCLHVNNKFVNAGRISIHLGIFNRILPETSKQIYSVCTYTTHEHYNSYTMENDIALIKLNKKCVFSDHVWPVCLPKFHRRSLENTSGFMLGWGKEMPSGHFSPTLKQVHVPVAPITKCSTQNDDIIRELKINIASHLCVGRGDQGSQYVCDGDSGGPFLQTSSNIWFVNGIISWADPTCNSSIRNSYTVLTKVSNYENWLANNMNLPFLENLPSSTD